MSLTLAHITAIERNALKRVPPPIKPAPKPKAPLLTPELRKAQRAFTLGKVHFSSGHHKGLAHIIAALCEVDPKLVFNEADDDGEADDYHFGPDHKGTAVVLLKNPNDHCYDLKKVYFTAFDKEDNGDLDPELLIFDDTNHDNISDFMFSEDLTDYTGNNAPFDRDPAAADPAWRYATATEIRRECTRLRKLVRERVPKPASRRAGLPF
jgi:hypothetical protein